MLPASDGRNREDDKSNRRPDESWNFNSPHPNVLHTKRRGISTWNNERDGGKDENKLDEFPETVGCSPVAFEGLVHESSDTGSRVGICKVGIVDDGGHHSCAEPHYENLTDDDTCMRQISNTIYRGKYRRRP